MEDFLYLEADEEITSVIDKLKGIESDSIGLVAPKGSSIAQSLVSLKLIQRKAKQLNKEIALITSDEVGRNLAHQVGLVVYADIKSKSPLDPPENSKKIEDEVITITGADEADKDKTENKSTQEIGDEEETKRHSSPDEIEVHRYDDPPLSEKIPEEDIPTPIESSEDLPPTEEEFEMLNEPKSSADVYSFRKRSVGPLHTDADRHETESNLPNKINAPDPISRKKHRNLKPLYIILGVVGSLAILFFANLLISKMTIKLSIEAEAYEKGFDVIVEKDRETIDEDKGIIGGQQIVKEKTLEESTPATGEKDVGEKAKGSLVFKNESGVDETIASGSTIKSSSGVEYTLDEGIVVPKAQLNSNGDKILGQASGSVTAKSTGEKANMPSTTSYSVSGKTKITVTGATSGGVTKKVKIIAKSDVEKVKSALNSKNGDDMLDDSDRKNGLIIFNEAGITEVGSISYDKNIGDEADKITAKAKVKYSVIAFKNEDLKTITIKLAEKSVTDGKGLIITDEDTIVPSFKEEKNNLGQIIVESKIKTHVGQKINLSDMARTFRMKSIEKIKQELAKTPGLTLESIDLTPKTAFPMGPILTKNIKINLGYTKK